MSEMGPPFTRRVLKRAVAPAKITIVDGGKAGRDNDTSSNKENLVNCSLYTLFENHYQRSKDEIDDAPAAGQTQINKKIETKSSPAKNVLQPRKRPLSSRRTDRSAVASEQESRELSPPELTTSDTFKPAKRTLPSSATVESARTHNELPKVKTPVLETTESCDVLVASPRDERKAHNTADREQQRTKSTPGVRRDVSRRTPSAGRRLSVLRLSVAREGGVPFSNSKADSSSEIKKQSPAKAWTNGSRTSTLHGKDMVFSAMKKTTSADAAPSTGCQPDVPKPQAKTAERRKSIGEGIGRYGGRSGNIKKHVVEKTGPGNAVVPQTNSASARATAESIRTRKLSMVLKNEQRLAEKNEQYSAMLRQLEIQRVEKDQEAERLRTAALMLNNMINRQAEENRDIQFKLKAALKENVELRSTCDRLERELRRTRQTPRLERLQAVPTNTSNTKDVNALTSRFNGLAVQCTRVEMEQLNSREVADPVEARIDTDSSDLSAKETANVGDAVEVEDQGFPATDGADQYTLQDLQDMVSQEEHLLKERCANALKELNLPFASLLTTRGSLDVNSLKRTLAQMSLMEENLSAERKSSIRKLSAWIGSS